MTISARDAGDPVSGVAVTAGGKHLKTAANGQASLKLRPGSYSARATASGYALLDLVLGSMNSGSTPQRS